MKRTYLLMLIIELYWSVDFFYEILHYKINVFKINPYWFPSNNNNNNKGNLSWGVSKRCFYHLVIHLDKFKNSLKIYFYGLTAFPLSPRCAHRENIHRSITLSPYCPIHFWCLQIGLKNKPISKAFSIGLFNIEF